MTRLLENRVVLDDNTTWGRPFKDLEWRLRYAQDSITKQDMLVLAGYLDSYDALIDATNARRNFVCNEIKSVLKENGYDYTS